MENSKKHLDIEHEFLSRCQAKMMSLTNEECPYTDEEFSAYKEGWIAAFQFSIDIFNNVINENH